MHFSVLDFGLAQCVKSCIELQWEACKVSHFPLLVQDRHLCYHRVLPQLVYRLPWLLPGCGQRGGSGAGQGGVGGEA